MTSLHVVLVISLYVCPPPPPPLLGLGGLCRLNLEQSIESIIGTFSGIIMQAREVKLVPRPLICNLARLISSQEVPRVQTEAA